MEEILKYVSVYLLSIFKFIFGPTIGLSYGFSVVTTSIITTLGTMTAAVLFSYFGKEMRAFLALFRRKKKEKKLFTKKNRQFVKIWKKYGVPGIAFFTPILLTPIGGAILANAFGGKKHEIIKHMLIWSLFWSFALTLVLKHFGYLIRDIFVS